MSKFWAQAPPCGVKTLLGPPDQNPDPPLNTSVWFLIGITSVLKFQPKVSGFHPDIHIHCNLLDLDCEGLIMVTVTFIQPDRRHNRLSFLVPEVPTPSLHPLLPAEPGLRSLLLGTKLVREMPFPFPISTTIYLLFLD